MRHVVTEVFASLIFPIIMSPNSVTYKVMSNSYVYRFLEKAGLPSHWSAENHFVVLFNVAKNW